MPAVNGVGEPCAGEPHARFDGGREETNDGGRRNAARRQAPLAYPTAFSQGRTRDEARENVRDALRELLLARAEESPDDTLTLTIAP